MSAEWVEHYAPNMDFQEIKDTDKQYIMNTYARYNLAPCYGKGALLYDTSGKEYIDFAAGIAVTSIGYANGEWLGAVTSQAEKLQHVSNYFYNEAAASLARLLCEKSGLSKVFLCNSGAEANECAIKLARKYSFDKYGGNRYEIVALNNSFHGRTVTTLSATGQPDHHKFFDPFTPSFIFAKPNDMGSLKKHVNEKTCAVIMEPVMGEGGVIPLDGKYIEQAEKFCKQNDILLIFDEIQTGIGRTGKLFAYEHFSVKPDIVTSAKGLGNGLPIGACLCSEDLAGVLGPGHHGSTFGGNPVVCAGASVVLKTLNDSFLSEVTRKGELFKTELQKLPFIESVRGRGLMLGLRLKENTPCSARDIAEKCIQKGLIIITAKNLLRIVPPLIISDEEILAGINILKQVMEN